MSGLTKTTKVFGVNDAKIAQLTADPAGGSATYSTSVDAPGVTNIKMSPKFDSKQLTGDEQILDEYTKLQEIDWQLDNAILSLDVLNVLLGGSVTTSGTTPAQTNTFDQTSTNRPNYFKLEGQSTYADTGDIHIVLWKCKANKVDFELKGGDYAVVSAAGTAIPLASNNKIFSIIQNETAVPIS